MKAVINGIEVEGTVTEINELVKLQTPTITKELEDYAYKPAPAHPAAVATDVASGWKTATTPTEPEDEPELEEPEDEKENASSMDDREYDPDEPLFYEYDSGKKKIYWDAAFRKAEHLFLTERGSPGVALSSALGNEKCSHDRLEDFRAFLKARGHGKLVKERFYERSEEGRQNLLPNVVKARETNASNREEEKNRLATSGGVTGPAYMSTNRAKVPGVQQQLHVKGQTFIVEDWPYFLTRSEEDQPKLQALFGDVIANHRTITPWSFQNWGIIFDPSNFASEWFPFREEFEKKKGEVAGYFGKPDAFKVYRQLTPDGKKRDYISYEVGAEAQAYSDKAKGTFAR